MMQTTKTLIVSSFTKVVRRYSTPVAAVLDENSDVKLKPWNEIPGPKSYPIIGPLLSFLPGQELGDINRLQENMLELYGPIVRVDGMLGRPPSVFIFDPKVVEYVYRSEDYDPVRLGLGTLEYFRKRYKRSEKETRPCGLGVDHHENWRWFRSKVNPVFLLPKTIQLYTTALNSVADDMIKRMRRMRNENNRIDSDFSAEINLWSLESIALVAFGGRLNCFDENLGNDSPEKRLIRVNHEIFVTQGDLDFGLSLWRYLSTPSFKRAMKLYEEQETLLTHFIQKARKEMLTNKKPDEEKSILEKLLEIDERVAIIMAADMMFAGIDTTTVTMISTLYLLAKNQDKQDKLREELTSGTDSRKYLRACLKESMRLLPVITGNLRAATKSYNIYGYRIPKGSIIVFNHQLLSRIESQFPRAKEYIPERWIEPGELYYKSAHPFAHRPFGFGSRMCLGVRIARLEMESLLAKLITNFKVEWFGPPPKIQHQLLNYYTGPYNFTFKDV